MTLNFISAIIIYTMSFMFFNALYVRNSAGKRLLLISYIIAVLAMVGITLIKIPVVNFLYLLISLNIINKLFYECKSLIFILYNVLLSVVMVVTDMMAALILSSASGLSIEEILNDRRYHIIRYLLAMLLLFVLFRIYLIILKKGELTKIKLNELVLYLLLTGIEIYSLYYVSEGILKDTVGKELIVMLVIYLLLDFYIAYLIYGMSKNSQLKQELSLARQQSNIQLSVYRELSDKYKNSTAITHDMKKQIKALEGLIDNKFTDKAREYTRLLNQEIKKLVPKYENDNQILSVIVSDKLMQAEKMNISLELNIENIPLNFISDLDVTAIFANILDNAIEACSEMENGNRKIKLAVQKRSGFLLINVSNKYRELKKHRNGFHSTKKGHEGIGLANVRNTVEKYDGIFDIETDSDVFIVKITIPIAESA
jgi:signal transduction histidine kinase